MSTPRTYAVESVSNGNPFRENMHPMNRAEARTFLAEILRGFRRKGAVVTREDCCDGFADYSALLVTDQGTQVVEVSYFNME